MCVRFVRSYLYRPSLYVLLSSLVYFEEKFRNGNERKIDQTPHKIYHIRPHISMPQIQYSEKYYDDVYEYRYAFILLRENLRSELGLRGRICPENAEW